MATLKSLTLKTRARRCLSNVFLPVVILLAINTPILGKARQLRFQRQLTFTAFEAPQMPLFVHGQQVVSVRDLPTAAGAQGRLLRAHGGHGLGYERGKITKRFRSFL